MGRTLPIMPSLSGPAVRVLDAELALWLPDRPEVRREILRLDAPDRRFVLRPDESPAGVVLETCAQGFHALLAGPERADIEVNWFVGEVGGVELPLWAIGQGLQVEANVWDSFGRLVVPDLLARGADAPLARLSTGRYLLTASVHGRCSLALGVGIDVASAGARMRAAG